MSSSPQRKAKIHAAAPAPRRNPNRLALATALAILTIAAVVTTVVVGAARQQGTTGGTTLPKNAATMGAGIVVNPDAPATAPTLDLYEDYQCPACAQFEAAYGDQITALVKANRVRLVLHTLSFLDDSLGNDSSHRAANASACAANQDAVLGFHNATFANQPAREGDGYTDTQLREFARAAGLAGAAYTAWEQCYTTSPHAAYVNSVQTQSEKDSVFRTPTIRLNGTDLDLQALSPDSLDKAVADATR